MVQWVGCFYASWRTEFGSLELTEKPGSHWSPSLTPTGEGERQIPEDGWHSSLAITVSSRFKSSPFFKMYPGEWQPKSIPQLRITMHRWTHSHRHTHTNTHMRACTHMSHTHKHTCMHAYARTQSFVRKTGCGTPRKLPGWYKTHEQFTFPFDLFLRLGQFSKLSYAWEMAIKVFMPKVQTARPHWSQGHAGRWGSHCLTSLQGRRH